MLDFEPAVGVLIGLVVDVNEEQLDLETPCADTSVAGLLDHVNGLSIGLAAAARKDYSAGTGQPPAANADRLPTDWRIAIPIQLTELAEAWREEAAWRGTTQAGGLELPAERCAEITVNELIVHGWDLAVATGQPFSWQPELVAAAARFVQSVVAQNPQGRPGLFGAPNKAATGASGLEQLVALTGRDPAWRQQG